MNSGGFGSYGAGGMMGSSFGGGFGNGMASMQGQQAPLDPNDPNFQQ